MFEKNYNKIFRNLFGGGRLLINGFLWFLLWDMLYNNNRNNPLYFHNSGFWFHLICLQILFLLLVYGNSFFLVPKFIKREKYGWYLLVFFLYGLLFTAIIGSYLTLLMNIYPGIPEYCFTAISFQPRADFESSWQYYFNFYLSAVSTTQFIFTPGWLIDYLFRYRRKVKSLSKLQSETELKLLKAQLHPHFLFNALNNIYSLSLKKSDKTPEMILKLSNCLRHLLYETTLENVPLENEIQLVSDYVAVEKIRIVSPENIHLSVEGVTEPFLIMPVLLLPFVENAVKHGLDAIAENAWVKIEIIMDEQNNTLHFSCRNSFRSVSKKTENSSGLGLDNVRKRLQLSYPKQHQLKIKTENNIFEVNLNLKLTKK